jgi:hypothetical protein
MSRCERGSQRPVSLPEPVVARLRAEGDQPAPLFDVDGAPAPGPVSVDSNQAPRPVGPNEDVWPITSLLEVGLSAEGHHITHTGGAHLVVDTDEKAIDLAAALLASVALRRHLAHRGPAA